MNCTHCHAPTADGITLCQRDLSALRDILEQIPGALEDGEITAAKEDVMGGGGGSPSAADGSAAPINLDAAEKLRELQETVHTWARMVLEDDQTPGLQNVEPVTYLKISVEDIIKRDDAGEMLDELTRATRRLQRAVDRPPEKISLGRCGSVYEGVACDDQIITRKGDIEARCRTCGATYNVAEVQASHVSEAWHQFETLTVVVRSLRLTGFRITERSAQRWVKDGELIPTRHRDDGTPIYTLAEVRRFALKMRERHGGKRVDKVDQVA